MILMQECSAGLLTVGSSPELTARHVSPRLAVSGGSISHLSRVLPALPQVFNEALLNTHNLAAATG